MTKNISKIAALTAAAAIMGGCSAAPAVETTTPATTAPTVELMEADVTVKEITEDYIMVGEQGEMDPTMDLQINVESLDEEDVALLSELSEGDMIHITYEGVTTMSLPAQLGGAVDIALIDGDSVEEDVVVETEVPTETATADEEPTQPLVKISATSDEDTTTEDEAAESTVEITVEDAATVELN